MATIHDEIDTWLAADLHGELSNNERSALHAHLIEPLVMLEPVTVAQQIGPRRSVRVRAARLQVHQ